ncbi:ribokinase [Frondihabitans sp. PhB188]|uniref:ribokinase n=1 Tax=Frondihabitans sp. PhB188 TaxID=2485200 RepID=UPI000F48932A|nr:ribokinase [Frondihabitans sp. PhB188]ROQ36710.1 ribokinase [Frondihabitans sp. PhB188]
MNTKRVIVVGSANQDYLVRTVRAPQPGETVMATGLTKQPGGKGANQAVAAARLGGDVHFVGAVGRDDDGARILRSLDSDGVSVDDVRIVDGQPTGLALISIDDTGENSITVVSGANGTVTAERAAAAVVRLASDDALLSMQGELPRDVLEASARAAAVAGARVVLNLAPYLEIDADVVALADPVIVNETEAAEMTGLSIASVDEALVAVDSLTKRALSAVITLGSLGAVWANRGEHGHVEANRVEHVVDTTGAGDAFSGALVSSLAAGSDLEGAVRLGALAGSFAVRGIGAQSSYPRESDLGAGPAVG